MSIEMHILDANGKLKDCESLLAIVLPEAAMRAAKLLNADGIDISVSPFKPGEAPDSGIGGYSFSPYRAELLLDSEREDIGEVIRNELPAVLGHEMHHCVRSKHFKNSLTLWECITTEGLATHFERQMNGGNEPSLFRNFPDYDWRELLDAARPLRDEKVFCFHDWFLGGNPERLPKYAGYFIGYKAVSVYQSRGNHSDFDMLKITPEELYACL